MLIQKLSWMFCGFLFDCWVGWLWIVGKYWTTCKRPRSLVSFDTRDFVRYKMRLHPKGNGFYTATGKFGGSTAIGNNDVAPPKKSSGSEVDSIQKPLLESARLGVRKLGTSKKS